MICYVLKTSIGLLFIYTVKHIKQEYSQSANLRQCQNFNQKWFGIRIRIFGLIRIRMCVGSVPKCCECVSHFAEYGTNQTLTVWEMLTNVQKPLFRSGGENEKVIRNPHADPDHHQKLITSRGSPLVKFGRRPFPRSSVILFTEWQNDRHNDHCSYLLSEIDVLSSGQQRSNNKHGTDHRCKQCFLKFFLFLSRLFTFSNVFNFFSTFFIIKKTPAKNQRETILNDTIYRLLQCLSAFHLHFKYGSVHREKIMATLTVSCCFCT